MADKSGMVSTGGQTVVTVASSGTTNAQAYVGAGRLCKAQVLTAGVTLFRVYDAATTTAATTSNHVYTFAQTTVAGQLVDLQIPFASGLVLDRQADSPGVRLSIAANTPYGQP
jgi:hypothetical protein